MDDRLYKGGKFLLEGGAYGHMNHPFDMELDLTFGDLKNIITKALKGDLELTREKTDGQALAISWRDDRGLIAARNKGHLANMGEKAMSIADVASKFGGRGGLTDAYNFAMRDLEVAIKGLSKAQRDKIFAQGKKFMNLEVIYPTSVNVIPYGQALLVFHNTTEYDESGVAVGAEQSDAKILAGMIKQINQDVQEKYKIQGPPITQLPKDVNLEKLQPKYSGMLKNLQSKFGLKDSDGMAEYHQAWWGDYVDKNTPEKLDKSTREGLIKRWAFFDKSFTLNKNNIKSEKVLNWAQLQISVNGATGATGQTGDQGSTGSTGPEGSTGEQGIPGISDRYYTSSLTYQPISVGQKSFEVELGLNYVANQNVIISYAENGEAYFKGKVTAYTAGDKIPEIYKDAARYLADETDGFFDWSPNSLYFFANSYADGFAKLLFEMPYGISQLSTGEKAFNPKNDIPLLGSFFGTRGNVDAREFAKAEQKVADIERRLKMFATNPPKYADYISKHPFDEAIVAEYNQNVNGELRKLRQEANEIRRAEYYSPADRKDLLRINMFQQNMIKNQIVQSLKAYGLED